MGSVMVLLAALVVLALVMYWIFGATARHSERRATAPVQPLRRPRRSPRAASGR